ncbi:hypothetical protein [Desulfitobacterium hafniense]|nr:hypothetical protein [Desulfitobacterium hafniense]
MDFIKHHSRIAAFIMIAVLVFSLKSGMDAPEKLAETVLMRTYGATKQDYEALTHALSQSQSREDMQILFDYVHTAYGEQLTAEGYEICIANRMISKASKVAYDENSDLKVSAIELQPTDALEGRRHCTPLK